jgi:hypothetical protein
MKQFQLLFILTILFLVIGRQSVALCQWRLADQIGIDFVPNGQPHITESAILSEYPDNVETVASIADDKGKTIFYLDAQKPPARPSRLLNGFNSVIPNSEGIFTMGNVCNGALIIPLPGKKNKYYLFTLCPKNAEPLAPLVLYRHTVDFSQSPNGVVTEKNILVSENSLAEKMSAVRHQNGKDWWLLLHGYGNATFYPFIITENSITLHQPQDVGKAHKGFHARQGEMVFSPDGKHLGLVTRNGIAELFSFDRCTGYISKKLYLGVPQPETGVTKITGEMYYGCSFSPNGKLFYYSTGHKLYQVPVDAKENQLTIAKKVIWEDTLLLRNPITQHELAPDNKIYIARYGSSYLAVIKEPDQSGKLCRFDSKGLALAGKRMKAGLPQTATDLKSTEERLATVQQDTMICNGYSVEIGLNANPKYRFVWSPTFGIDTPNASKVKAHPTKTTHYKLTVLDQLLPSGCDTVQTAFYRVIVVDSNQPPCSRPTNPTVQPASIKTQAFKESIKASFYPNPASDFVHLSYETDVSKPVNLEIYDATGRRVYAKRLESNRDEIEINCQNMAEGNYVCRFLVDGKVIASSNLAIRK